jgi:hypothetical protein
LAVLAADLGLSYISFIRMGKGQDEDPLVSVIAQTAFTRAAIPEPERIPFTLLGAITFGEVAVDGLLALRKTSPDRHPQLDSTRSASRTGNGITPTATMGSGALWRAAATFIKTRLHEIFVSGSPGGAGRPLWLRRTF